MHKAKVFAVSIATFLLIYGALGFYALPFASFDGDLTRISPLPESQFGWIKPQPEIEHQWFVQSSLSEADVLVIGDSFSDPRVWQTVLVQRGVKVRTELWGAMPFICGDLGITLKKLGFKGRFVVIESVERNLSHRLKESINCQHVQYQTSGDESRNPPPSYIDRQVKTYASKLLVGINTLSNAFVFNQLHEGINSIPLLLNEEVTVQPIDNGCNLFSHPACSHALFYAVENAEDQWEQSIESIIQLNTRLGDIQPIWVIVPNKSTTYRFPNKKLWGKLQNSGLGPDILQLVRSELAHGAVDLYPGNNTHFSTEGYLQLGSTIATEIAIRQRQ